MALITFRQPDGVLKTIDIPTGITLMEAATLNDVQGLCASCGGDGGCATCHIYLGDGWLSRLGEMSRKERNTLRFALKPGPTSRLACQIVVKDLFDGLTVIMPERQF